MQSNRKWTILVAFALIIGVMTAALTLTGCGEVKVTFMNGDEIHQTVEGKPGEDIGNLTVPVRTGYEFEGWQYKDGNEFTETVIPAENTTVYAKFNPNAYKVEFNLNGGYGIASTVDAVYGTAVEVPSSANNFRKSGYTLTGWAKTANADAAEYALGSELINLTAEKNAKVVLYAYYEPFPVVDDFVFDETTVYAYVGTAEAITLPNSCTKVEAGAFKDNLTLKEVIIPDTYTEIGFGAFEGCDNLEKLTVPFIGGSVEDNNFLAYIFGAATYTDNTFSYNMIDLGTGSQSQIDESTITGSFYIPRSLRIVTINSDVAEIPEGAFYYAFGLEKVIAYRFTDTPGQQGAEYSYRIKKVGASAFEGCHRIGKDTKAGVTYRMDWLSGVEEFGDRAFKNYITANSILAGELADLGELTNVRIIGEEAFTNNLYLAEVKFGEKLERIGKSAFASCNLMQRVIIPDSCTYIGDGAFEACIYLASVSIGKNVEHIGSYAFGTSAAMTEVFFRADALPAELADDVFYGVERTESGLRPIDKNCNEGLVFYFETEKGAADNAATLKAHYPSSATAKRGEKRGPFYYMGNGYDYMLTFSEGHIVMLDDPYMRTGFGIPVICGKYERMTDVWYDAEIYDVNFLLDINFTVQLDYYLSGMHTHYHIYKVDTFTLDGVDADTGRVSFTIGNRNTDEWALEENIYGQIGLFHNGTLVEIAKDKGATYVVGGTSQYYADRKIRTFVYRQGNEYFEQVLEYQFVYVPNPDVEDGLLTYYGKLYLDETNQNMLFGDYETANRMYGYDIHVDELINEVSVMSSAGNVIVSGKYTTDDTFGNYTEVVESSGEKVKQYGDYTATVISGAKTYTFRFTDYLENVMDPVNNQQRNIYARCIFSDGEDEYVLYNSKTASSTLAYGIRANGTLFDNDYYILKQYRQYFLLGEGDAAYELTQYPGFGEHSYVIGTDQYHDYLTYVYEETETGKQIYNFKTDSGSEYTGEVSDSFTGTFRAKVGNSGTRNYVPYFADEAGLTFSDGKNSVTLTGYGRATYTDEKGNSREGKYNVVSDTAVAEVYVTRNQYATLVEYTFKPDDGGDEIYFVPNFFDAYDGSMKKGDMLTPDITRNRTYRMFDNKSGVCTAIFASSGYGMGVLYIMVDPDTNQAVGVDNYFFAPGATMAYYEKVGMDGEYPMFKLYNGLDMGYFVFTATDRRTLGTLADTSKTPAYVMTTADEYNGWWKDSAALLVTGDLTPPLEDMELMTSREEKGVYTSPNGYTLEVDGDGNAVLKDASGSVIHNATYVSVDGHTLGATSYLLNYTVGNTTYKGRIYVDFDLEKGRNSAIITLENFEIDGVRIDNFSKGEKTDYSGANGVFTIYDETRAGMYLEEDGKNVFAVGKYEKTEDEKYVFRFDDRKVVCTLDETNETYTIENSYKAVRLVAGDYSAGRPSSGKGYLCGVEYGGVLRDAWQNTPDGKVKNELTDSKGNTIETDIINWYGYEVLARKGEKTPLFNTGSEYVGTSIMTGNMSDGTPVADKYFYYNKAYDAEVVAYEDGEIIVTYNHLDIIEITNKGTFHKADKNCSEDFIIMNRGNGIVVYVNMGLGQG